MIGFAHALLSGLGQRTVFAGTIAFALIIALWVAFRKGRQAAQASYAIRRADARVRALHSAKDTRHDVETTSPTERDRRLSRWMRD